MGKTKHLFNDKRQKQLSDLHGNDRGADRLHAEQEYFRYGLEGIEKPEIAKKTLLQSERRKCSNIPF